LRLGVWVVSKPELVLEKTASLGVRIPLLELEPVKGLEWLEREGE
jgi:hypothetical protein